MINEKEKTEVIFGNIKCFTKLVNSFYPKVYYHCLKIMKNDYDAADVTQNTFVKAYINLNRLNNPESFGVWIFTICNNEIRMFYRKNKKTELPHAVSREKQSYGDLYAAIDVLDEKYRNLIVLRYFSGFGLREIAGLTGLSVTIVKSRLYDARKKLKALLSENPAFLNLSHNKERRYLIMSVVKLLDLGAKVIPCMSVWGQKELLKCAKENQKFSEEVLTELSRIDRGDDFVLECKGRISYDEMIKILTCCDEAVLYRMNGQDFKTWRNGKDNPLLRDIAEYMHTGGYVDSVETILYVPSMIETVKWYKKYLGWGGCDNEKEIEEYGYSQVYANNNESAEYMYHNFKGFHLRQSGTYPVTQGSCFVFVSSAEKIRNQIIANGCEKVTEIKDNGWGTKGFEVTDLNGLVLEFC